MPILPKLAPTDLPTAVAAAECVVKTHQRFREWVGPEYKKGTVTLAKIDAFVAQTLADLKCRSCFLHYRAGKSPLFPSHACLSVNDCVVHGTAAYLTRPMQKGDLFKLDIGVWHGPKGKEMIGDAAWTYSFGKPTVQVRKLMD
jgi:methionyl aminopeptidase